MIFLVDTDPLLYKLDHMMEPTFYWVGLEYFSHKNKAITYAVEQGIDPEEIIKQSCMLPPYYVKGRVERYFEKFESLTKKVYGVEVCKFVYFLSGNSNFRKEVDPEYKATRTEKPFYIPYIKEIVKGHTKALLKEGYEADDLLALAMTHPFVPVVCCSIDKDLLNIPGSHYNYDTGAMLEVSWEEGFRSFIKQIMTGDRVDNIKGIPKMGDKKAEKVLELMESCSWGMTWESFRINLDNFCDENKLKLDNQRMINDAILLDVGGYWAPYTHKANPKLKEMELIRKKLHGYLEKLYNSY